MSRELIQRNLEESLFEIIGPHFREQELSVQEGTWQECDGQGVQGGSLGVKSTNLSSPLKGPISGSLGVHSSLAEGGKVGTGEQSPHSLPPLSTSPSCPSPHVPCRIMHTTAGIHSNLHWLPSSAGSHLGARDLVYQHGTSL